MQPAPILLAPAGPSTLPVPAHSQPVARRPRVCAVIPAHNEAPTIAAVVEAVRRSPLIDEVLVVSDGSTDATTRQALQAGADRVLETAPAWGKGQAMRLGVSDTDAEVLCFVDGDLVGLTPDHITRLVYPVLTGRAVMNVGLRDKGRLTPLMRYLPLISGERALQREVFDAVPEALMTDFRAEVALNHYARRTGGAVTTVPMNGLSMRRKYEKTPPLQALSDYLKMGNQIASAWLAVRTASPSAARPGSPPAVLARRVSPATQPATINPGAFPSITHARRGTAMQPAPIMLAPAQTTRHHRQHFGLGTVVLPCHVPELRDTPRWRDVCDQEEANQRRAEAWAAYYRRQGVDPTDQRAMEAFHRGLLPAGPDLARGGTGVERSPEPWVPVLSAALLLGVPALLFLLGRASTS